MVLHVLHSKRGSSSNLGRWRGVLVGSINNSSGGWLLAARTCIPLQGQIFFDLLLGIFFFDLAQGLFELPSIDLRFNA
jgi:hypothetical protein